MMDVPPPTWKDDDQQQKQSSVLRRQPAHLSRQTSLPAAPKVNNDHPNSLSREELKLAAVSISLNVRLRSADMPISMLERAFRFARSIVDTPTTTASSADSQPPTPTLLARSLKKEFDRIYGPAWHCVVGKSFGSFVTHSKGGFVYFSLDSFSFLLFKTEVHLLQED
ncbi:hypothetical protein M9H77_21902 [Catharanthus roseus]|uniref:Uncharacterized protein n=1 Tax=Catharanthus roseus TaxID=4058 RepID=A0ACC0AQZ7_CATRO|nr:hypothetical protein M9H77_21902 [Catharanthus roseus]